jgi:hypothetical protein
MLPPPIDTGTAEIAAQYSKGALGAWETKVVHGGVMLIRPGIAFALTEDKTQTKARGVGKKTLERHKRDIIESWNKYGPKPIMVSNIIFKGGKSSITPQGQGYNRSHEYGQWIGRDTIIQYNPEPKRPYDTQRDGRLSTWALPSEYASAAYDRMLIPAYVRAMRESQDMFAEQPDVDDMPEVLTI